MLHLDQESTDSLPSYMYVNYAGVHCQVWQSIFVHILFLPFCGAEYLGGNQGGREGREELEDYIHRRSIIWEGDNPLTLLLTRPFLCPLTFSLYLG